MITLKVVQIEDGIGVVLPDEVSARLKVKAGDVVYLSNSPDGYRLVVGDAGYAEQMIPAIEL